MNIKKLSIKSYVSGNRLFSPCILPLLPEIIWLKGVFNLRAMWRGSLSFGLVNIPVRLFAATENKELKFRSLHSPCHNPLEYRRVCPTCKKEVPWEEISRGYEYERGHFVVLTEEEIEAAAGEKERLIEIEDFVNLEEIDPIYYQKSYYLAPEATGKRPYALLRDVMGQTGKIAVATITLRTKETPAVVRIYNNALTLSTMYYPEEIRPVGDLPDLPLEVEIREREFAVARELVESLTVTFNPAKYRDRYREKLLELIEAKVEGKEIAVAPSPAREKVVDLLEALQASVEKARKKEKSTAR